MAVNDKNWTAMTLFVPLESDSPVPAMPSLLNAVANPTAELGKVIKAILKAKHITFVCGELLNGCMIRESLY